MQYISAKEYLMGRAEVEDLTPLENLTIEQIGNMNTLISRVNQFLEKFGSYRKVTSGIRSMADHKRIYAEINAKRKAKGLAPVKVPMNSKHLICAAVDLEDADGKLMAFARANTKLLRDLGLWCETRQGGWLHMQIFPPKSGALFFNP